MSRQSTREGDDQEIKLIQAEQHYISMEKCYIQVCTRVSRYQSLVDGVWQRKRELFTLSGKARDPNSNTFGFGLLGAIAVFSERALAQSPESRNEFAESTMSYLAGVMTKAVLHHLTEKLKEIETLLSPVQAGLRSDLLPLLASHINDNPSAYTAWRTEVLRDNRNHEIASGRSPQIQIEQWSKRAQTISDCLRRSEQAFQAVQEWAKTLLNRHRAWDENEWPHSVRRYVTRLRNLIGKAVVQSKKYNDRVLMCAKHKARIEHPEIFILLNQMASLTFSVHDDGARVDPCLEKNHELEILIKGAVEVAQGRWAGRLEKLKKLLKEAEGAVQEAEEAAQESWSK